MKFRSELAIPKAEVTLTHSNAVTLIGSCFADAIGNKLKTHLFDCCSNPLGTVFNPLAIATQISRSLNNESFDESEFFYHRELWQHDLVHGSLASTQSPESTLKANTALTHLSQSLKRSRLLIITFGSAWVYQKKSTQETVAHNHRRAADDFDKRLVEPDEICEALSPIIERLERRLPNLKICLTVSPVRHSKDGLHENNLSKSSLHLSVHKLTKTYSNLLYFPAFEILNDELRDYRFYASDLAHPSEQAIDYIWEGFKSTFFDASTLAILKRIENIDASLKHRPHHPNTKLYSEFKSDLLQQIRSIGEIGIATEALEKRWSLLP